MAEMPEQAQSEPLSRIRSMTVKRLFGLYDHEIPLNLSERVTIIHGPNGVGKTVLLRLVHSVFAADFMDLATVPFDSLRIELDSGESINIRQTPAPPSDKQVAMAVPPVVVTVDVQSRTPASFRFDASEFNIEKWAQLFERDSPYFVGVGRNQWVDRRTDRVYTTAELWKEYGRKGSVRVPYVGPESLPPEMSKLLSRVRTYQIEANRLIRTARRREQRGIEQQTRATVTEYANELAIRIRDAITRYGTISQRLDQSFPQRLFQHDPWAADRSEIKRKIEALEEQRESLKDLGLLEESVSYPFDLSKIDTSNDSQLGVMSLYVRDSAEKLRVLSELADRVKPLIRSINEKFKNKSVKASKERGLVAHCRGTELELDQLSSGEQHEIVLLYNLLFRIPPNTLVLIDEPELSLHIDWQRQFLPELLSITTAANIDALLATHSPSIAGERDDLMVELDAVADY